MNTASNLTPPNPYLANLIMSASPVQLIVLLQDGLIRFLGAAYDGFSETDPQKRLETINNNLIRAQNIITELDACLDMEKGGEVAHQLRDLYLYFNSTLRQVNINKDATVLLRIIHMVSELRDAWSQIATSSSGSQSERSMAAAV